MDARGGKMELGFKDLSFENFLQADEMTQAFVSPAAHGANHAVWQGQWAKEILAVGLSERVPIEVQRLFAVARGAMLYGCFFYPLFTLSSEQLFRAAEASVAHKCRALGAPPIVVSFFDQIKWLREIGILSAEDEGMWHSARKLRNNASHPTDQTIFMPGQAIVVLETVAADIDRLYANSD